MMMLSCASHRRFLPRLVASVGAVWMAGVWAGAARAESRFLDQIHTLRVPAIESFVAAERFSVGRSIGGRPLGSISFNFTQHFSALVEGDVPAASVSVWSLRYTMGDASLVQSPVARLAHVHAIIEMGGASAGHTDWRSNLAYVRSPVDHRLWAVHWSANHDGEWTIGAVHVPHADLDWPAGSRLFSASSVELASNPPKATRPPESDMTLDHGDVIAAAFGFFNLLRLISYFPQIVAVARDDSGAAAISISCWKIWIAANFSTALYAGINLGDAALALVSVFNAACCAAVLLLALYKRLGTGWRARPLLSTSNPDPDARSVAA